MFLSAASCAPPEGEVTKPGSSGAGGAAGSAGAAPAAPPAGTGGGAGSTMSPPAASGGASGSSSGTGGSAPPVTPPSTDPAPADASAPPDAAPGAPTSAPDPGRYTCTLLFGINATAEWYNAGFETLVDNARWQLVRVHSGFVDKWADPASPFWGTNPTSPCANGARTPDRIIFVGLRFEWTSKDDWVKALTAVVKNLKDKFPGVKRIELATFVRGPGNKPCSSRPAYRSTIHPSQDEAIAEVVATDPKLLFASPKFEVNTCSDFSGNPPHFSAAGGRAIAKKIAEHYADR